MNGFDAFRRKEKMKGRLGYLLLAAFFYWLLFIPYWVLTGESEKFFKDSESGKNTLSGDKDRFLDDAPGPLHDYLWF